MFNFENPQPVNQSVYVLFFCWDSITKKNTIEHTSKNDAHIHTQTHIFTRKKCVNLSLPKKNPKLTANQWSRRRTSPGCRLRHFCLGIHTWISMLILCCFAYMENHMFDDCVRIYIHSGVHFRRTVLCVNDVPFAERFALTGFYARWHCTIL